jgi:hypothetical protein
VNQNTKKIGDGEEGFLDHHALEEEDLTQQQREWMARHWPDRQRRFRSKNVVPIESRRRRVSRDDG